MYTRRTDLKYEPGWVGLGWVHEDARGGDTPHHLQPRRALHQDLGFSI